MAVDLDRVRVLERQLHELVEAHPETADRTAAYFAGDLAGVPLEALVSDLGVPVKLPPDLVAMVDELLPAVEQDRDLSVLLGRVSRASVARLALLYGVQRLREDLKGAGRG